MKDFVSLTWIVFTFVTTYLFLPVSTQCDLTQGNGYCSEKTIHMTGDFNVAVTLNIHKPSDERVCDGNVSISGFQAAMAVAWLTEKLNEDPIENTSFVPGLKFGYTINDDCGLPSRTVSYLENIFHTSSLTGLTQCSSNCTTEYNAIITSTTLEATEAALTATPPETPLISSRDINRANIASNHFYIGNMLLEINGILSFLEQHTWNFISVLYTNDSLGMKYYSVLKEELSNRQRSSFSFCFLYLPTDGSRENVSSILKERVISEQANFAQDETFGVLFLGGTDGAATLMSVIRTELNTFDNAPKQMFLFPSYVSDGISLKKPFESTSNRVFLISQERLIFNDYKTYLGNVILSYFQGNSKHLEPWISKYVSSVCGALGKKTCSSLDITSAFIQEDTVDKISVLMLKLASSLRGIYDEHCKGKLGYCSALSENLYLSSYLSKPHVLDDYWKNHLGYIGLNHNLVLGSNTNTDESSLNIFERFKNGTKTLLMTYSKDGPSHQSKFTVPASVCKAETKCLRCIEQEPLSFGYVHGDVYLLGLFSIRQDSYTTSKDDRTLFHCGEFRQGTTAVVTVSAFLQSVNRSSITDIKFGAIALDDCYNELNISALLTDLFAKRRILKDPKTNTIIDFDKVVAVIGALSSRVTQPIADMMTSLHIPMVSYGASATTLDNRIRYPYFMRTVPSDSLQIQGIIKLLLKLNVKHIGSLYIDDVYGASGDNGLYNGASSNGICISTSNSVTEDSKPEELKNILLNRNKYNGVEVIVLFAIDTVVAEILGNSVLGDSNNAEMLQYAPVFISSEGWGTDHRLANKESLGALIFTTDSSKRVDDHFKEFLSSYHFGNRTENPWLYKFLEEHHKCNSKTSFSKQYANHCGNDIKLSADVINTLSNEQRIVHTDLAVNAVCHAYETHRHCTGGACFKRDKTSALRWSKAIRQVQYKISSGTLFQPFKSDGNGNLGFTINQIQKVSSSEYSYVKVGTYNGTLDLQSNRIKFYDELGKEKPLSPIKCPANTVCQDVCTSTTPIPGSSIPIETTMGETQTDALTIILGTLAGLLLFVVILLVVLLFRVFRSSNQRNKYMNGHIQMSELTVPVPQHKNVHGDEDIYHEPPSIFDSHNDLRHANHNAAYTGDDNSDDNGLQPSSLALPTKSRVVYSDMSQTFLKTPDYSQDSNENLKALTKRVLQPINPNDTHDSKVLNNDSKITYLSANDLCMQKSPSLKETSEPGKFIFTSSKDKSPGDTQNVCVPPGYFPEAELVIRPATLPGIQPFNITPENTSNSVVQTSEPLYTNDMYLIPISDTLPTYEQHLRQQLRSDLKRKNGIVNSPSQILYTDTTPEGTIMTPSRDQSTVEEMASLSTSSSFDSPSVSVKSLSPLQKEALLNRIIEENPTYFLNQCNQSQQKIQSPISKLASPTDKFKQQILNALVDSPDKSVMESIGIDDGEEVMI